MKIHCQVNEGIIRILLVAFNFIFSVLSIALIALGVVYLESIWWPDSFASLNFIKLPIFLIVLGSLSFLASLAGCYCSKSNNKRHLAIFIVCLLILMALELTVAIVAFSNVSQSMENNTRAVIKQEYQNKSQREKFHELEEFYDCCGVDGVKDSFDSTQYCCQDVCGPDILEVTDVQTKPGCSYMVAYKIEKVSIEAGSFTIIYGLIQGVEICLLVFLVLQY